MSRALRLALALAVLVALSASGAVRAESRNEDQGVPQVTLEYEDDYEETREMRQFAYDEMDDAAMVRENPLETPDPPAALDGLSAPTLDPRHTRSNADAADVNLIAPMLQSEQASDASRYGSTGTGMVPEEQIVPEDQMEPEPVVGVVEPEIVEPEIVEPEVVEPEIVEPKVVEPAPSSFSAAAQSSEAPLSSEKPSDETQARQAALARRAAEEAEVKAAEAAEKSRRDTGAPVEKEAPATVFDYYTPPVLEPVYVGGYYKRANPWDKGKRGDDGAL